MSRHNHLLSRICEEYSIPSRLITEEETLKYRGSRPTDEQILGAMTTLDEIMEHEVILIGGLAVHPLLLGFRKMRRPSNDIDCVASEEGIRMLVEHFRGYEGMYRTENYGDLFLEIEGIPCSFDLEETHGWSIPKDFIESRLTFELLGGEISTISPEYLITLKTRRSLFKNRVYGKDKQDIANMMLAPHYKEIREVDFGRISRLMKRHVTQYVDEIRPYLAPLLDACEHLKKEERAEYQRRVELLEEALWD